MIDIRVLQKANLVHSWPSLAKGSLSQEKVAYNNFVYPVSATSETDEFTTDERWKQSLEKTVNITRS